MIIEREKLQEKEGFSFWIIPEVRIHPNLDEKIRRLLELSFPWTREFRERSYWHIKPVVRYIAFPEEEEEVAAHISVVERTGVVEETELKIAGVGAFAVHPRFREKRIGKELASVALSSSLKTNYDLIVGYAMDPISRKICQELGFIPSRDIFEVEYPDGGKVLKHHTLIFPISEGKYKLVSRAQRSIYLGSGSW